MKKQTLRDIIEIDEDLCDGCGLCIPNCEEGALVLESGKVRLVEDVRCDGAGACLGHCPQGALRIVQRTAEDFDERYLPPSPQPVKETGAIHAASIGAEDLVRIGLRAPGGCPGSRGMEWKAPEQALALGGTDQPSALRQWPIQLHLLSPAAPFLRGRELLLAADCVAFSLGCFHGDMLAGRSLAIACPKLDDPTGYEEKLAHILAGADVPALRVAIMEVPCCGGLVRLAQRAAERSRFPGEIEVIVVSRFGDVIERRLLSPAQPPVLQAGT